MAEKRPENFVLLFRVIFEIILTKSQLSFCSRETKMVDGNSVLTSQPAGSRQGYGRGHGPFALKGPLENLRGC